ncbi:MAG: putative ABC exporter domain-containing protein [Clostridiales bacterium]|nr:putative ABC exporter domain-containing protein [Clostridiales bacterium]
MRLFFYYVSHSLLNTLKKLLKTWVAVFLVLAVGGAVIGGIIGLIASAVIKEDEPEQNTTISITEEGEETDDDAEIHLEFSLGNEISAKMKEYGVSTVDVVDLVISVLFLVVLATNVVNAKSSGKIFQPADVPMLFASPLRPQSVLMFRLLCTLGSSIFVSFFMLYQVPNLMNGAKLGFWGALSCVVVYMLILMFSTLVQVTFYTITSKFDNGIELTNKILIGIYGLIGAGFAAYVTLSKKELVPAVFGYFAGTKTHWVPFWGWLRGIAYYASKNDLAMSGVYMGLFVAACFFLILFIWKMKADFYEDAMFATERKAEALENAQRASNGATVIREKERKGKIDREGFRYGSGANVFFYKAVYNRFRFAKLKIFSTTMIVYLISAVTISYVVKNYATGFDDMFFIPAAAMGIIAFYRTLGDPIREDTSREFFLLIPEKGYTKIMYSLLGCLAVTAIDLAVPMVIAGIMLGTNPVSVLVWFLFILSVSFFATNAGTFIALSIPGDHAQTIKTVLQIMFLYLGIGPSAAVVLAGVLLNQLVIALAIGAVMNFIAGFLLSLLLPLFLGRK